MSPNAHAAAKEMEQTMPDWKLAYRVPEAAAATGFGESTIWKKIKDGKLTARRDGNVTVIERTELQRYLQSLPAART